MKSKVDVCYHHSDADGMASAAVVQAPRNLRVGYQTKLNNSSILTECNNKRVLITDFSFPEDTMKFFHQVSKELIWIDHHEDSKHLKSLNLKGIHDTSKAGCLLTWEYFNPDKEPPDAIRFVNDYDLWQFKYEETKAYCAALALTPGFMVPTSELWQKLLSDNDLTLLLVDKGKAILEKVEDDNLWHARSRTYRVQNDNQPFLLVNCTANISSCSEFLLNHFNEKHILLWDVTTKGVSFHGRGENVRELFKGFLRGHPNAVGGALPMKEGLQLLNELYAIAVKA